MATAQIQVLHSILHDGKWLQPGPSEMDADAARQFEARGQVDVLSVDGAVEVWAPCCDGAHGHQ